MKLLINLLIQIYKIVKIIMNTITCLVVIGGITYLTFHLTDFMAYKDAVIFDLEKIRFFHTLLTIAALCPLFSLMVYAIEWLSETFSITISMKYLDDLTFAIFLISIVLGLILTQNKSQFELTTTFISFLLIFIAFFPKELLHSPKKTSIKFQPKGQDEKNKNQKTNKPKH
ncbi:hypothetical protein FC35_GL001230 [Limosilactobacillus coleohominis DSM 14060]|nr:hypothetical protein FC35_GL001230 [Limosilactobacillus coleohominis DSM 14060]